jgi:hypothetical protein
VSAPDHLDIIEAREALKGLAHLAYGFFRELQSEGFDKKQALSITIAWLQTIPRSGDSDSAS